MTSKIDKRLNIFLTKDQQDKLRLFSFYSGKSIGAIIRKAVDKLNEKDFIKK